jgi:hypothetical protein
MAEKSFITDVVYLELDDDLPTSQVTFHASFEDAVSEAMRFWHKPGPEIEIYRVVTDSDGLEHPGDVIVAWPTLRAARDAVCA